MVDWITHLLVPWIGSKIFQLRSTKLRDRDMALIMLGAVIPDIVAINYLLPLLGIDASGFLLPFHTPFGSLVVAAIASFLFSRRSRAFGLAAVGVACHFALDALLLHAGGGMVLLFPFSWIWGFQLGLIPSDSWIPTMLTIAAALLLYAVLKMRERAK